MAVHSGVKPYSCSKCGRRFYWHFQIKKHKCDGTPARNRSAFSEIDCSRSQPVRDLVHSKHLICDQRRKTSETDDTEFWKDVRQHQTGFTYQRKQKVSVTDTCKSEKKSPPAESADSVDIDFWKETRKSQLEPDEVSDRGVKKPFSCSDCGKTFLYIFHLNSHKKSHRRQSPLSCSVCGQKCLYESHLKIHMRTHTGEKPFGCPVCGKKYAHKASMQSHLTVHSLNRRYSCGVCGRSFGWFTELKYHRCEAEPGSGGGAGAVPEETSKSHGHWFIHTNM
uniref:C2H2-type domain-containing protein n=1 Tax=Anabas testudineus TaxID=64144 RepID=A0A7N6FGX8_ANATE